MKNRAIVNFISSTAYQVISLLLGLLLPKYYTELYGSVYNGLNQLTSQVMSLLSILQYGISAVAIQQTFKYMATDDKEGIAAIYQDTGRQYRNMGCIFITALLPITVLFPYMIKDSLPYTLIAAFLLIRAFSAALEYFFQAKYSVILIADNKSYLIYIVNSGLLIFSSVLHILALVTKQNILMYQLVSMISVLVRLVIMTVYMRKKYSYLNKKVPKSKFNGGMARRKDVLISEIAGLVVDSTDLVVLSTFSGLVSTSIYSVYNFVVSGLGNVLGSCREAVFAGIGKTLYTDFENFKVKMSKFISIYFAIVFYLYSVAIVMFKSFIEVYTAKMDADYVYAALPIMFILARLIVNLRIPAIVAVNSAGHFKQVKNYAVVEAIINLALSLLLVFKFGIYGVLIGTVVAATYRTPLLIYYANKNVMKWSGMEYWKRILIWIPVFLSAFLFSIFVDFKFANLIQWVFGAICCSIVFAILFFVWMLLFDKKTLLEFVSIIPKKGVKK